MHRELRGEPNLELKLLGGRGALTIGSRDTLRATR